MLLRRFGHALPVDLPRVVVGLPRRLELARPEPRGLLRPALIDGVQAPFRASP